MTVDNENTLCEIYGQCLDYRESLCPDCEHWDKCIFAGQNREIKDEDDE